MSRSDGSQEEKFEDAEEEPSPEEKVSPDNAVEFDKNAFEPSAKKYGLSSLLQVRQAMGTIEKPEEVAHFKLLHSPERGVTSEPKPSRGDREGPRGSKSGGPRDGYRTVPDMGKTEVVRNSQKGQWWRNACEDGMPVIVREDISLMSKEIWKVPAGHYVQQNGPAEVFVNGQAKGLQRMPVAPGGWVTLDATSVGGPKYLESVRRPRWRVIFKSGSSKGDIVVRESASLASKEVAALMCGTIVEQSAPQMHLEDGIIRLPILIPDQDHASSSSQRSGWVTCDATSQGGPKFFEPCGDGPEGHAPRSAADQSRNEGASSPEKATADASDNEVEGGGGAGAHASSSRNSQLRDPVWNKNRTWKVANLPSDTPKSLALVNKCEPYAPTKGKVPPDDTLIMWLQNGDLVEQTNHSKKIRSYMVMPVRCIKVSGTHLGPMAPKPGEAVDGWVTRRLVDKTREHEETWFEEVRDPRENGQA